MVPVGIEKVVLRMRMYIHRAEIVEKRMMLLMYIFASAYIVSIIFLSPVDRMLHGKMI